MPEILSMIRTVEVKQLHCDIIRVVVVVEEGKEAKEPTLITLDRQTTPPTLCIHVD